MKAMIRIIRPMFLLFLFISMISLPGCEEDEITGDSSLKIINQCNRTITIYFDDTKLGKVSANSEDTWDVPSGTHTVRATCYMAQDYEGTHTFKDGQTVVLTLNLQKNYENEFILEPEYQQSTTR